MHLKRVSRFAIAIGPLLNSQSSLNVNRPTLGKVLRCSLCLTTPKRYLKPSDLLLPLAGFVFAPLVRRHSKATHRSALGRVAQFRIAAQVAHENNLVERHEEPLCVQG